MSLFSPPHLKTNALLAYLSFSVFLAYLLPEWISFINSDVFVYVNGWDEETYLSWQGILGSRNSPGYFALYFNWLLQRIGISGAYQNILLDTLLPPVTVYFAYRSFRLLQLPVTQAFAYAVMVFFSSTLFNYGNPLVKHMLGPYDATGIFMAGWEVYPSILRTPNPQISYFLISIAVYGFLKHRKFWMLLLPFPLLYFHVAVPCLFLLTTAVIYNKAISRYATGPYMAALSAFLMSMLLLGVGFMGASQVMGLYAPDHPFRANGLLFVETRHIQFPLALVVMAGVFAILKQSHGFREDAKLSVWLLLLTIAAFGAVNLQIFTGFMLSQKNYYDYGLSLIFGVSLVIMMEMLRSDSARERTQIGVLVIILMLAGISQVRWYRDSVVVSRQMVPIIEQVRKDPLHAVIPDLRLSSRLAYSTAMLPAPPLSYQYYFWIIEKQCDFFPLFLDEAFSFANEQVKNSILRDSLGKTYQNVMQGRSESKTLPYLNFEYCSKMNSNLDQFYLISPP